MVLPCYGGVHQISMHLSLTVLVQKRLIVHVHTHALQDPSLPKPYSTVIQESHLQQQPPVVLEHEHALRVWCRSLKDGWDPLQTASKGKSKFMTISVGKGRKLQGKGLPKLFGKGKGKIAAAPAAVCKDVCKDVTVEVTKKECKTETNTEKDLHGLQEGEEGGYKSQGCFTGNEGWILMVCHAAYHIWMVPGKRPCTLLINM